MWGNYRISKDDILELVDRFVLNDQGLIVLILHAPELDLETPEMGLMCSHGTILEDCTSHRANVKFMEGC